MFRKGFGVVVAVGACALLAMPAERVSVMVGWGLLLPVAVSLPVAAGPVALYVYATGELTMFQQAALVALGIAYLGAAGVRIYLEMT